MEEGSPDIITKYQKLATEYSKLRAQAAVLKKAVSEEQGKSHDLKEALKEKDQSIRKLEQEVECLNFRNLQLTKRVSILQNDLEVSEEKVKKTKNKTVHNSVPLPVENETVLNAELLSRIEENEKVHRQVFETEVEHKKAIGELTMKVESLESQLEQQRTLLSGTITKHEETIDKLSRERMKLELSLKNYEKEVKDTKLKDDVCQQELEFVKQEFGTKLEEAKRIVDEKIFFNDTRLKFFNALSVPVLLHQRHRQLCTVILELKTIISDLTHRLSDLHSYMEQKICSSEFDSSTSALVNTFAGYLHENTQYLKGLEAAFTDFASSIQEDASSWLEISSLKGISVAFNKYIRYLDKLLPYLLLSIQAEDSMKGTTPRLKDMYKNLQIISQSLIFGFRKLEKYIELLVKLSSPSTSSSFCVSRPVLIKKIIASLYLLQSRFEEARKVFGAKVFSDHQLPTATESARTTDDCILSSMISISSGMKKITGLLEEKTDVLENEVPFQPRGVRKHAKISINPCVPAFRERGVKYMSLIYEKEPPSMPLELALMHSKTLSSYASSKESLTQQLQACQAKLGKLELDKEHWMIECQLLKTKKSRMSPSDENSNGSPEDDETFQTFVKASVNQLVTQVQVADSKALSFQTECENLHQKLTLAEQRRAAVEKESSEANETVVTLKEEQRTLMKNYEDQLSTMSEHLATMNETLTKQKDEIDELRSASSNKSAKKGKGR